MDTTSLGLDLLEANLEQFILQGEAYVADACLKKSFLNCLHENSYLRRSSSPRIAPTRSQIALAIDVGGTHSKVSLARFQPNGTSQWSLLFDLENYALYSDSESFIPLRTFTQNLSQKIHAALEELGISPLKVTCVSVVWSNQIEARPLHTETTKGVTGIVTGIDAGTYRKSEWFIEGLKEGFDLGALFLSSLQERKICPDVFLLGNDTVFTLTASPGAHGGVVASSGGNCTNIGTLHEERDFIFNTEIGSLYKIPREYLTEGDLAYAQSAGAAIALEDLLSGKWIPRLVESNMIELARKGAPEVRELSSRIMEKECTLHTRDIAEILSGTFSGNSISLMSAQARETLTTITQSVIRRAAVAAGALSYFSVANLSHQRESTISLDSAMARYLPGYYETLTSTFNDVLHHRDRVGRVHLMEPFQVSSHEEISVPLIGATYAAVLWT